MLFKSLHLQNILSFKDTRLDLQPLNVLIGPNGSGKTNLIEVMAMLIAVPDDLPAYFRRNPIGDWVWNGELQSGVNFSIPSIEAALYAHGSPIEYGLHLAVPRDSETYRVNLERLETPIEPPNGTRAFSFFKMRDGRGTVASQNQALLSDAVHTELTLDDIGPGKSVLSAIRHPLSYPTLTDTARKLSAIKVYRSWEVGPNSPARRPQPTDGAVDFLEEDFSNLALIVNDLQSKGLGPVIDDYLQRFYEPYKSLHARVYGNRIELMVNETGLSKPVPATRLSDGTLKIIALLAILCHPEPPPLICIEEPEIGLHPDSIDLVVTLLRKASERTQIIVTTHSPWLVDRLSATPEQVVVVDQRPGEGTQFKRYTRQDLEDWLEDQPLGETWMAGAIGGVR